MNEILAVIEWSTTTNYFHAGIVLRDDKVIEAAPVIKFMKGWTRSKVRSYVNARGWKVSVVSETASRETCPK